MAGMDARSDEGLLVDQIRHAIDPEDYVIPGDERLNPAQGGARDPINFPDFAGKNTLPENDVKREKTFDPNDYGTLDYQLDIRTGVSNAITVNGSGMIASGRGYLQGFTLHVAGGLGATDAVAFYGKSNKIYAIVPADTAAWHTRDIGNGIAYDDLIVGIYDLPTQRVVYDRSCYVGGIAYVAPMEGSF